ncbi:P-loop containing nucleoside triphosphate hydrolase protein [Neocallimastix californiae]|uniref:p-loop containing nucleoside triphosphate hydrolase protein n=1 Tax=Neocallimastix californiae TaxID=1754190 RepID=A0A1Y2A9A9_9FUNG|nr:P-loop containing nucleoside triphosphate hydrolase protein [Neocallimastix californiae]|eukprot:ORY19091.1 P-loop containing nucleoside triphosphate hydrolase protein [Neocallimastix californiae]
MNNIRIKCPICKQFITEEGIKAHLESNCQYNIVKMDGTVISLVKDGDNRNVNSNGDVLITSKFQKNNSNHIYLSPKSVERKKTVQSTLFGNFKRKSNKYDSQTKSNNSSVANKDKKRLSLAELVRPKTLKDYFGQEELIGEKSILKTLIMENRIPSLILWGPPGVGKTCLARVIANHYKTFYKEIRGALHSFQELKNASEECANYLKITGKKAILFIDEIHKYNKLQQDSLLSLVENGSFILIGATTENPSFKLNSALLSRCRVFQLKKLNKITMMSIVERAAKIKLELFGKTLQIKENSDRNIMNIKDGNSNSSNNDFKPSKELYKEKNVIYMDKEIIELIANLSDGDARHSLNILDTSINFILSDNSKNEITKEIIKMSFQKAHYLYDKNREEHYDLICAFHKSIRGGDENATLYWLGRMIYRGEDPLYIARRLIRIASEDIGFGDNYALTLATSCYQACQFIGMPECDVILAHTAVYMSRAPKSVEVYKALAMVKDVIQQEIEYPVPIHLRNTQTSLMEKLDYGESYKYNPDYEEPVEQEYLPKELKCRRYLGLFI